MKKIYDSYVSYVFQKYENNNYLREIFSKKKYE